MDDSQELGKLGVKDKSVIHLVLRLRGGESRRMYHDQ